MVSPTVETRIAPRRVPRGGIQTTAVTRPAGRNTLVRVYVERDDEAPDLGRELTLVIEKSDDGVTWQQKYAAGIGTTFATDDHRIFFEFPFRWPFVRAHLLGEGERVGLRVEFDDKGPAQ